LDLLHIYRRSEQRRLAFAALQAEFPVWLHEIKTSTTFVSRDIKFLLKLWRDCRSVACEPDIRHSEELVSRYAILLVFQLANAPLRFWHAVKKSGYATSGKRVMYMRYIIGREEMIED
jgi:hypothetical protein